MSSLKSMRDPRTWSCKLTHQVMIAQLTLDSAQMDATLNDIPPSAPFKVAGFPTLKFRAAGSSEFTDYNGGRSLEDLLEFVEANKKSEGPLPEEVLEDKVDEREEDAAVEGEEDDVPEHDEL